MDRFRTAEAQVVLPDGVMLPPFPDPIPPVLHVNTNTRWGGGENQVFHLVKGLHARGGEVCLAAPEGSPLLEKTAALGIRNLPLPEGIRQRRRLIREALGAGDFRLVHLHDSGALQTGCGEARRAGVPVVFSRRVASPLRRNPFSRLKYSPRNLTSVLAISETVRDVMIASGYPADRIFVAPSGLPFEPLDAVTPLPEFSNRLGGRFLVGGLGALSWKKNWELLVRLAAHPTLAPLDIQWVIAGRGGDLEKLQHLARELGVAERVHFLGFRNDGLRVLKSLDALFFPSLMEGASVTVREAMALEVPVVIHDTPGCVESLGGHGWVVRGDALDAAAETLRTVLSDPDLRRRTAAAARRSAQERFSFDTTLDQTLRAYAATLIRYAK